MEITINPNRLLWVLSSAIDFVGITDLYHGKRVAYIADQILKYLPDFPWSRDDVIRAALIHDCGVSSSDAHEQLVINMEWFLAQEHCIRGAELLQKVEELSHLSTAISYHHTRWCELGTSADEDLGNLLFLADRIDVCSAKSNSDVLIAKKQVVKEIKEMEGILFNPDFTEAFFKVSLNDAFWLDWLFSHEETVMGSWLKSGNEEVYNFDRLKELFGLFSSCVDAKSSFTYNHSEGVANLSRFIADQMGCSEIECEKIELAGLLHDLGKLKIPDRILEKPGLLEEDEFLMMKHHSYDTFHILSPIRSMGDIVEWAMQHHEKLNGKGYPSGLTGEDLSLPARIIACADIFQALAQDRPYRKGLQFEEISTILREMSTKNEIDQDVVNVILDNGFYCTALAIDHEMQN